MLSLKRRYRQELLAISFLWPSLLVLATLLIYPLGDVIRLSFYDSNLQRQVWVGLGNYLTLLNDPLFWKALLQTVIFTFCQRRAAPGNRPRARAAPQPAPQRYLPLDRTRAADCALAARAYGGGHDLGADAGALRRHQRAAILRSG